MLYGENYRVSCLSHQFLFIHVSLVPTTFSERLSFRDTRSFLDAESSSSFSVLLLFVLSVAWTCRSFSFWKCFDFSASLKPLFLVHFQPIFFFLPAFGFLLWLVCHGLQGQGQKAVRGERVQLAIQEESQKRPMSILWRHKSHGSHVAEALRESRC